MTDLVQFLRARLDEDETTARESGGRWMVLPVSGWVHTAPWPSDEWKPPGVDHHVATVPLDGDRAHIVRHDPARVLAEVDAKRRILGMHNIPAVVSPKMAALGLREGEAPEDDRRCAGCGLDQMDDPITPDVSECPILRALALPYASHPDYRDEWRPGP